MNKTYHWSQYEVDYLLSNYNILSTIDLQKHIPRTRIAIWKKAKTLGLTLTKEMMFKNRSLARTGEKGANWKGGKTITKKGYVYITIAPNKKKFEHVLVMEKHLGRILNANECVHHIDGNKQNNSLANLKLMTKSEHSIMHNKQRIWTDEQRKKQSVIAKLRNKNGQSHPLYKPVDMSKIKALLKKGLKVQEICNFLHISKSLFYSRRKAL